MVVRMYKEKRMLAFFVLYCCLVTAVRCLDFQPGTFNGLTKLEILNLSGNDITILQPGTFNGLISLVDLDLSWNDITIMQPGSFSGLTNLADLDLSGNDITILPNGTFDGLRNLANLDLSYNDIATLQNGTFDRLTNLVYIDLSYNDISKIHSHAFHGLSILKKLNLSSNDLEELRSDMFIGLSSLKEFYLQNNKLTRLDSDVFMNLPRPLNVRLGNRLQCDTNLCWLKHEYLDNTIRSNIGYSPQCLDGLSWDGLVCSTEGICPEPGGMVDTTRSGALYPYTEGSTVDYICDSCLSGGGTITCLNNGVWTERNYCQSKIVECMKPLANNIEFMSSSIEPYQCGSTMNYTCHSCSTGVGTIICQDDGTWSKNQLCTAVECYKPQDEHVELITPSTGPYECGSNVSYTCDSCSTGGGTLICQEDGTWTADQLCTAIKCTAPVPLEHATFEPSTGPYKCGTAVTYSCDTGYKLHGSSRMICTSTGAWDQLVRLCIESNEQVTFPVIYVGLGSGIAGSIITAVVVAIVVAIVLKRRKKKTKKPHPLNAGYMNPVFPGTEGYGPGSLDNRDYHDLAQVFESIQPRRDQAIPEYESIHGGDDRVSSSYQEVGGNTLPDVAVVHASPEQIGTISDIYVGRTNYVREPHGYLGHVGHTDYIISP